MVGRPFQRLQTDQNLNIKTKTNHFDNIQPELIQYWKENNIGYSAEKEIWYDFDEKAEIINQNILNEAALTKWD
jgi:hypothetical protein